MSEYYHRLEIWQRAQSLCLKMHRLSLDLPQRERFGLIPKLRNASELVPIRIAQGACAIKVKEFIEELTESYKLLITLKTEILIVRHLQYAHTHTLGELEHDVNALIKMVMSMVRNLQDKEAALHPAFAYTFPPFAAN